MTCHLPSGPSPGGAGAQSQGKNRPAADSSPVSEVGAPSLREAPPELPLEPGTLLIGDLHLDLARADAVESFVAWLGGLGDTPRLVVLGDLFEFWVGPAEAESPGGQAVLAALARRVAAGTGVEVVPGNRDFLLDRRFERASGARLWPRGFVGLLPGGGRALVVHGDELCTLDLDYQRLRRVLRSAPVRGLARVLPLGLSRALARRLRRASTRALQHKPRLEAEQQADEAQRRAAQAGAAALVCGHAHRFRDEVLAGGLRWWVVDAFGDQRDTLRLRSDGSFEARHSGAALPGPGVPAGGGPCSPRSSG
jgi:UDP-2,3-diacylglucosamine hydrolase